jgi:hypothetical protein
LVNAFLVADPVAVYLVEGTKDFLQCMKKDQAPVGRFRSLAWATEKKQGACTFDYSLDENVGGPFASASCTVPPLELSAKFGVEQAEVSVNFGTNQLKLADLASAWKGLGLTDVLKVDASTSIGFIENAKAHLQIGDGGVVFDITVPGLRWKFDSTIDFNAQTEYDPCSKQEDQRCKVVLNDGYENLLIEALPAGTVPLVLKIDAEVYFTYRPQFAGMIKSKLNVRLDGDVVLTNTHMLTMGPGKHPSHEEVTKLIDAASVKDQLKEKLKVELKAEVEADIKLELCVGVKFSVQVDGAGVTVDVPYCVEVEINAKGKADLGGGELKTTLMVTQKSLDVNVWVNAPGIGNTATTFCDLAKSTLEDAKGEVKDAPVIGKPVAKFVGCLESFGDRACHEMEETELSWENIKIEPIHVLDEEKLENVGTLAF